MTFRTIATWAFAVAISLPLTGAALAAGTTNSGVTMMDDHGNGGAQPGDDKGGAAQPGDDKGGAAQPGNGSGAAQPGDDKGGAAQPGNGSGAAQPGDDKGGAAQPGNGSGAAQPGDDKGGAAQPGNGSGAAQPGDDKGGAAQPGDDKGVNSQAHNTAPPAKTQRLEIPLAAASVGSSIQAQGHVTIRVRGDRQVFKVEVEANVPDGSMFNVSANGVPLGVVRMRFNEGELEVDNDDNRQFPAGFLPSAASMVTVTAPGGDNVLEARFGAIGTAAATQSNASVTDTRKRADLSATPAGSMIGAHGNVDVRMQGQRQRIKVEVDAGIADGTVFHVFVNDIDAGTITARFEEAELELSTDDSSFPAALSTAASITNVRVVDATGTTILQATL